MTKKKRGVEIRETWGDFPIDRKEWIEMDEYRRVVSELLNMAKKLQKYHLETHRLLKIQEALVTLAKDVVAKKPVITKAKRILKEMGLT